MRNNGLIISVLCCITACSTDKDPFSNEEEDWSQLMDDADGDGFGSEDDCNDSESVIFPGAEPLSRIVRAFTIFQFPDFAKLTKPLVILIVTKLSRILKTPMPKFANMSNPWKGPMRMMLPKLCTAPPLIANSPNLGLLPLLPLKEPLFWRFFLNISIACSEELLFR